MAPRAVLVLDIDGTITTAEEGDLRALRREAKRLGVPIHINTARDASYCDRGTSSMGDSRAFAPAENHHCLVRASPPASKVANMHKIQRATGTPRDRILLVDDRPENVRAVRTAGYAAHLVRAEHGITARDAQEIVNALRQADTAGAARRRVTAAALSCAAGVTLVLVLSAVAATAAPSPRAPRSRSAPPRWPAA